LQGILIESPTCDGVPLFPQGTAVQGRVQSVRKVGLGFRHETAALQLEFNLILPDDGPPIAMNARVLDVDNARENVKDGIIRGIRSTATEQNRLMFPLAHLIAWTPFSYWIPLVSGAFPIVPDPEIYFPAGTDLRLELMAPLSIDSPISPTLANRAFDQSDRESFDSMVTSVPQRTSNMEGRAADVVNLLFLGSREQVEAAFRTAGWTHSDPLSARAVLHEMHAVFSLSNDPELPMARHLLNGEPSDSTWQKGLNSYAKRDHLRIWNASESWNEQTMWLAAATAEAGATFSLRRGTFVHQVVSDVDQVREKVVRDLSVANCVERVYNAPRPDVPASMTGSTGTALRTDSGVAVIQLRNCQPPVMENTGTVSAIAIRPRSKTARIIRTEVLSLRNLWRNNIVYDAVDLSRVAIGAIRTRTHDPTLH
jgi:LssY C-terminus